MQFSEITVSSRWCETNRQPYYNQNSNTLAVVLPGISSTLESPTLYYPMHVCLQMGFDVLGIQCGFQCSGEKINIRENLNQLIQEAVETMEMQQ